jgi:lipase chaperone LimK
MKWDNLLDRLRRGNFVPNEGKYVPDDLCEEAADRIEDLERQRAVWQEHFDHMAMQIAEARNAALEEAAVYLENMDHYHARDFAHYIRFIKDKQP